MVIIGCDHSGVELKNYIKDYLKSKKLEYIDVSENTFETDDYPDIAFKLCKFVLNDNSNFGISICGTGIGMSIVCNKIKGIRAAVITDSFMADMCKRHNNANIICIGSRLDTSKNYDNVINMIDVYINTKFEGERHNRRLEKIVQIEEGRYYGSSL